MRESEDVWFSRRLAAVLGVLLGAGISACGSGVEVGDDVVEGSTSLAAQAAGTCEVDWYEAAMGAPHGNSQPEYAYDVGTLTDCDEDYWNSDSENRQAWAREYGDNDWFKFRIKDTASCRLGTVFEVIPSSSIYDLSLCVYARCENGITDMSGAFVSPWSIDYISVNGKQYTGGCTHGYGAWVQTGLDCMGTSNDTAVYYVKVTPKASNIVCAKYSLNYYSWGF